METADKRVAGGSAEAPRTEEDGPVPDRPVLGVTRPASQAGPEAGGGGHVEHRADHPAAGGSPHCCQHQLNTEETEPGQQQPVPGGARAAGQGRQQPGGGGHQAHPAHQGAGGGHPQPEPGEDLTQDTGYGPNQWRGGGRPGGQGTGCDF